MLSKTAVQPTFEAQRTIQPIYTGGSVALDQTGRVLATCVGEDALLSDLETGEQLARIEGDGEVLTSLSLTPSASHLIVCSRSLSMRIYALELDASPPSSILPILERTLKPHTSPVITSSIDSTGTLLATGGADGIVKVWDIRGGYVTHTFRGHGGIISALHFFEVIVKTREMEKGISSKHRKKARRKSQSQGDQDMPDAEDTSGEMTRGFRLASGGEDGKIRVWDLRTRKGVCVLDSHVSVVRGLDYSTEEEALVSASRDKTIILWDARSWKVRKVVPVLEGVESAGFVGGGEAIFTGGETGRVRVWETDSGREITQEQVAGGEGENIVQIIHHRALPFLISVHGDQSLVLRSVELLSNISADLSLPSLPRIRRISGTHDEIIDLVYLTPERSLMALATNSEDVRIISVSTCSGDYFGADVALLRGHEDIVICLDVDWSGNWLATGAKDNTARLWRIDPSASSYTCVATFSGHAESLGAIALPRTPPPVGSAAHTRPLEHPPAFLLTGSQDRTIKRWDVSVGKTKGARARYTRKAHDKDINALDVNHNGALFASASQDRTVKIWTVEEGEVQGVLRGHRRGVWSVRFAPKDAQAIAGGTPSARGLVLTGSGDKTIKIWRLADYSCLLTLEGHTNSVLKVLWLPPAAAPDEAPSSHSRSSLVASAGGDGLVKVWDASSGTLACTLDNHTDRVWALTSPSLSSLSPPTSQRTLVSGSGDSTITFWADTTALTLAATSAASTARVEAEQRLSNLTHAGSYREAIVLALTLAHPGRLLALFTSLSASSTPDTDSLSGRGEVDAALAALSRDQLLQLMQRLRDWNTNARTAPVAQRILAVLVRAYPAAHLAGLGSRRGGGGGEVREVLEALRVYSERHYKRLEELAEESWMVEWVLGEMDEGVH
ncbi:MAG: U3 small nucleolar RNA-associated protein 13 [Thelocarpon impressellum]|nr:MAG: U3 small nucleolar RNA-associated protein 13 [Thelocarpon impressellum]